MNKRRGHGEGGVYRRADGMWVGALDLGFDGVRRRRRALYGRTKTEALAKLAAGRRDAAAGLKLGGGQQTLAEYVTRWLEQRDPRTASAGVRQLRWTTWMAYEARMRCRVLPALGMLPLAKVEPDHIRAMLAKVAAAGLSRTTVAMVRDTLATIMQQAVKDRLIPYNPVRSVDSVTRAKPRAYVLTADDARALLRAATGDPYEAVVVLALHAGLRASELFGLKWDDIDLDTATLTVRRSLVRVKGQGLRAFDPKTHASAAAVPLTSVAVAALRAHRVRQIERRLRAGSAWQETPALTLGRWGVLSNLCARLCVSPSRR